jgi:hypothetical protein
MEYSYQYPSRGGTIRSGKPGSHSFKISLKTYSARGIILNS